MSEQPQVRSAQVAPPATPNFECVRTTGLGAVTLEVRGHIDVDAADELQGILRTALSEWRLVVLDLHATESIDPVGVYAVVRAGWSAQRAGRRLVIVRATGDVGAALEPAGADSGLTVIDTDAGADQDPRNARELDIDIQPMAGGAAQHVRLVCRGELEVTTASRLRRAIAGSGAGDVVVDLTDTVFIDSRGLSTLLDARQHLHGEGHRLVVVCPSGLVRDVFRLAGLAETLNVVDDRAAVEQLLVR